MAFPVSTRSTGELITATVWNGDLKDNLNNLYAGTIAIANQANGRIIVASSTTQHSANKNAFVKNFIEAMS